MAGSLPLHGRRVLLGVTGSIAAYKAADICSRLGKLGADVYVVMTPEALQFIGPATFRALTTHPVMVNLFEEPLTDRIAHIDLAQGCDLVLVAPATANVIAKMAMGIADDLLTTCLLAVPDSTPLLIAPAMNTAMWQHAATQTNMATIVSRGTECVSPGYGVLACKDVGYGKLADVDEIVTAVCARLNHVSDYKGIRVLITAGPTREPLDPVRYISNRSSGKMGYALAAEALRRGASVLLISGPTALVPPVGVEFVAVQTAEQMLAACLLHVGTCDVIVGAAAVADYRVEKASGTKMKRHEDESLSLRLIPNPDIIAALTATRSPRQFIAGFAAETDHVVENASRKLRSKGLDLVVSNDVSRTDAGFDVDTNEVTLHWPDGTIQELPLQSKLATAGAILSSIAAARSSISN